MRRLAPLAAGAALLAAAAGVAAASAGPLNPALTAEDLAAKVFPASTSGELRKTQGENCVFDYDGDGLRDIFLSTHGTGWRLLKGTAQGTFVEVERFPGTDRHGCAVGDFGGIGPDGGVTGPDGRPDIYAAIGACQGTCDSPFPNELWLQRPEGGFLPDDQDQLLGRVDGGNKANDGSDFAKLAGVADVRGRGREPLAIDVNRDGLMDLFVGNDEGVRYDSPNRLFVNDGDGTFHEQPLPGGLAKTEVGSVCSTAADWNGDGWTDLVNCSDEDFGRLQFYRNDKGVLRDATAELGLAGISDGRDVELGDLNGDGAPDLAVARFGRVEVRFNRGGAFPAVDYGVDVNRGMEVAIGDADGDGRKDLYALQWDNSSGGPKGKDLLLRNLGRLADDGRTWAFEPIAIPQQTRGNGDTVQAIPNWNGSNRTAFLINNGKWDEAGRYQLLYMTGPSTGAPVPETPPPGPEEPGTTTPTTPTTPMTPMTPTTPAGPFKPTTTAPDPGPRDGGPAGTATDPVPPGPPPTPRGEDPPRGRVVLSVAQLRINQRISQAAVRRVNALEAILEGRPAPRTPARSGPAPRIQLTVGQLRINQRISAAALRRVARLEARLEGRPAPAVRRGAPGRLTLSAAQLRINQRISQAAVRRVNALAARIAAA